jgi:N-acetylmuramic acid 6-phosphate (MurNAc-6-P) etherase
MLYRFIRTLRAAERGLFAGYQSFPSLPDFSEQLERLADACRQQRLVVMSGCGTSGRLAFLTARRFGSWQFRYAIAGGDSALLLSDELPEDSPLQGRADLPSSECFVVGVSCGLSAPYVAGQLALSPRESAVIGFNPTSLARNNAVDALWPDGRKGSFRDLVGSVGHIINPVIGPEPVAGSSRMKGGTATLILLDVLCLRATNSALGRSAKDLLHEFEVAYSESYAQLVESLPPLMQAAGEALRAGGRLFYLGAGSAAIVGLIDLSEMPDTYGSPFDQSRAFIAGGWQTLGNVQGDLSRRSRLHRISLQDFRADLLNSLSEKDFVVALVSDDASESHVAELSALLADIGGKAKASCISVGSKKGQLAVSSSLHINLRPDCVIAAHDLAVKLALNAISTYAQAFGRGALFKGMMIACGPSNDKIYSRCLGMIRDCCKGDGPFSSVMSFFL